MLMVDVEKKVSEGFEDRNVFDDEAQIKATVLPLIKYSALHHLLAPQQVQGRANTDKTHCDHNAECTQTWDLMSP